MLKRCYTILYDIDFNMLAICQRKKIDIDMLFGGDFLPLQSTHQRLGENVVNVVLNNIPLVNITNTSNISNTNKISNTLIKLCKTQIKK